MDNESSQIIRFARMMMTRKFGVTCRVKTLRHAWNHSGLCSVTSRRDTNHTSPPAPLMSEFLTVLDISWANNLLPGHFTPAMNSADEINSLATTAFSSGVLLLSP